MTEVRPQTAQTDAGWLRNMLAAEEAEAGMYLDRLSDQQRYELLREQKGQAVDEACARHREEYREQLERFGAELSERTNYLRERLFKVSDTGAGSRAATANEDELAGMLDYAMLAGLGELGRAVFVAAEMRGLADLMGRYFSEIDPDARDLYNEWRQAPTPETLERQIEGVEQIVHRPSTDDLMSGLRVGAYQEGRGDTYWLNVPA
jgi:hypothetical protein